MTGPSDDSRFQQMADAELRALEKDKTLPQDAWHAVMEELRRRDAAESRARPSTLAPEPQVAEGPAITAALHQLRGLLVPGELLEAYAVQRRLFAITHRRQLVAATSGRLIVMSRGLIRGYQPTDIRWQDIEQAHLHVGVFGATLTVTSMGKEDLASAAHAGYGVAITGLRPEQAERVYRVCQAQSQAWREKRRIRDLDELRARSGGVQLGALSGLSSAGAATGMESASPAARLQRAKEMRDGGLITDAEYESIKARVIDQL
jgi:hypothetical protein